VSTRDFSWGKGGRCVWLTTYHPCSAETSRKSGVFLYPEPLGPPRPVAGDLYCTLLYFSSFSNMKCCPTIFFHFLEGVLWCPFIECCRQGRVICFTLLTPYIWVLSIHQPTNTLSEIK